MAAFERIDCGIEGLNQAFDSIRLGDNVVWQVGSLADFLAVAEPFVAASNAAGKTVHYMRFASHEALLAARPGIEVHEFAPNLGFEAFTLAVRHTIDELGPEALYVFDSLSDLQVAWSADMMMGNFFRLTCPRLFQLDTVAYFPVLRGRHSFAAIAKIRDTTQLLIDLYRDDIGGAASEAETPVPCGDACELIATAGKTPASSYFVHPLKVWNRYSATMFLPHRLDMATHEAPPCTNGVDVARFYEAVSSTDMDEAERDTDSWDRFFAEARRAHKAGELPEDDCAKMCNMMMSKDPHMREMVRRYFAPEDYFAVRRRMVGTGLVGGKACGMLLARKIVATELPESAGLLEPHDSFYIGTDVFYSYIVANELWEQRIAQRSGTGFVSAAPALSEGLLAGSFPEDIRESFRRMLAHFGQTPIIVRSSSFLEDGFGNAFAGKYESVFCANVGAPEERLAAFEDAVRTVYASMMDPSALEYRLRNGLDGREEQMALLVQRVSGSRHITADGRCVFMPTAAGVGYSHAAYRFLRDMDPSAGMLRLVAGLGTRAVDRKGTDYPRLVNLDRPLARAQTSAAEQHRFSQRQADLIDLTAGELRSEDVRLLSELLSQQALRAVFEHDREAERRLAARGSRRDVLFASCEGLIENAEFTRLCHDMLHALHEAYGGAVDIEFTVNVGDNGCFVVNLLQCRPLAVFDPGHAMSLPALDEGEILFTVRGEAMGTSRKSSVGAVVVVDPKRYYHCPHASKPGVATLVGEAAEWAEREGLSEVLLLAPGRIGTSSPELGVPVSFAQICRYAGVCELGYSEAGYAPELSYGSHMFQDLVEASIYYAAIPEDEGKASYRPELLERLRVVDADAWGGANEGELAGIVSVFNARGTGLTLWHDQESCASVCGFNR